ncbi:hypothetical protein HX109_06545 [Galbibacter sp. BG1]|uniref:hypothetical protein n=1 Tax=Galbibacter sp. BG1 TaxID=1170699 RepID=UPI0015BC590E|nr:hypothetical protein [Galbibacter sp. BG1]QLE01239.1 hypothetical protein HX109_06545 [Galbibacter sp. BG1]
MLSKGLKDEENERISRNLERLLKIEFVPELWQVAQQEKVSKTLEGIIGLSLPSILETNVDVLLEKLLAQNLSFEHYEQIGDLLFKLIRLEINFNQQDLAGKIIAIYNQAQIQNKTYSFELNQKIQKVKAFKNSFA